MARFGKTALGLAFAAAVLTAGPAGAVSELSGAGSPTGGVELFGAKRANAIESRKDTTPPADADTAAIVPETADWVMILIGFGLLGALNRRSDLDRLRDEMVL